MATSTCSIPGCSRPTRARSWCIGHYNRWHRTGDTGPADLTVPVGTDHPNWGGPDVKYRGAHRRVSRIRGRASEHTCECGVTAQTWAYDHQDPDEKVDDSGHDSGHPFSTKPEHYRPLCYACHWAYDRKPEVVR